MARKFPLLTPGSVGPSGGPFGDTKPGKLTALSPFGHGKGRVRVVTTLKRGGKYARGGKVPRFDFGGLFGGQPGQSQSTGMQTGMSTGATNNNIASANYNVLRENTLGSAANLDFSDPNKYIADFNADQQNAFQGVRNTQGVYQGDYNNAQGAIDRGTGTAAGIQGSAQPYVDQAGQMQSGSAAFNPFASEANRSAATTVGDYTSPFQANAMDAVAAASNKAFGAPGGPMERINDTFTGGNAAQFGRERHGDVMGNAVYNQQQALDQQLAQLANTGWQTSLGAAGADLNRQANLAGTAGQLANADIATRAGLGKTTADIGTAATAANLAAGKAEQDLGTARQTAGYTDANALLSVGNQQQQLEQQKKSLPLQGLQYQQSLGQGWQLPTSSNFLNTSNTNSNASGSQSQPQGSIAGQVVGAGTALAGALGGDNNKNPDGTTKSARGGQINPFGYATGGYVPTVTGMRKRNAMRKPPPPPSSMGPMGGMGGMQPTGMPGMPPPAPPGAAALNPMPQPPPPMPHPANRRFARGGVFAGGGPFIGDEAQDRRMIERGIHQHERQMHKATTGQLTKLRLARGGRVPGYDTGGPFASPAAGLPGAPGQSAIPGSVESPFSEAAKKSLFEDFKRENPEFGAPRLPPPPVAVAMAAPVSADSGVGTSGVGGSASDGSGGSAAAGTSGDAGSDGSGTYAGGGSVPGYRYGGLEIRGTPTPSFRGNLPTPQYVDDQGGGGGREVPPVNPLQWFERANPASMGGGSYVPGQWAPLAEPSPADIPMLNRLHRQNPEWYPQYDGGTPAPTPIVRSGQRASVTPFRRVPEERLVSHGPIEDEPRSGYRGSGYGPAADRNFFDRLFSWLGGKGYHAQGGQANPLGTDSRAGFGAIYKEPLPAGRYGYARGGDVPGFVGGGMFGNLLGSGTSGAEGAAGGSGLPFLSMATDAYGIGNEAFNGDQGETDMPATPFDPASGIWHTLSGGKAETEDEGGRLGHNIGYEVGDVASMIFPPAAPLFREGFGRLGSGIGEIVQGKWDKGLQNLASGTPFELLFHAADGGRVPGYATGSTVDRTRALPGDRATLDEAPSTGPFGETLKLGVIGPSRADFGHFGPLAQQSLFGNTGSSGSGGSSGGDISSMGNSIAKMIPLLKNLFGSGSVTPGAPTGSGPGGAYTTGDLNSSGGLGGLPGGGLGGGMPDIDTEIADWSSYGGFARGGEYEALDEEPSTGPFGEETKKTAIGPSEANYGQFGPLAVGQPPVNVNASGGGGGGAGSAMSGAGGMMGGLGGLLGGVSKLIPFLAEGGGFDDADIRGGYSPFLDSSAGLDDRMNERRLLYEGRPQAPSYSPEERARMDAEADYERQKGGLRRWGEQVYGDIAKPVGQIGDYLRQGDYGSALEPVFAALGSGTPAAGATGMALRQTLQELRAARMAHEAAKRGLALRREMGR